MTAKLSTSIGIDTYPFYVKPGDVQACPKCKTMPSLIPVMFLAYNMKCENTECPISYPDAEFIRDSDEAILRWNKWAESEE